MMADQRAARAGLHGRQAEARARVDAKIEESRPEPARTSAELREIIRAALDRGEDVFELRVHRSATPKRGKPLRLPAMHSGRLRFGPESSEDAPVVNTGGYNYTTRWRCADALRWLERLDRGR